MEMRTENCEPFQPRPLRPQAPVVFKPCVFQLRVPSAAIYTNAAAGQATSSWALRKPCVLDLYLRMRVRIRRSWVLRSLHFGTTILLWSDKGMIFTRYSESACRVPTLVGCVCFETGPTYAGYSSALYSREVQTACESIFSDRSTQVGTRPQAPDKPGRSLPDSRFGPISSSILRFAGVLEGHNLLRVPRTAASDLQRPC